MKCIYKKSMSSFEILENSFGGSFPSTIKLEAPPTLIVKIVEDSFIQKIIIILSWKKRFKFLYGKKPFKFSYWRKPFKYFYNAVYKKLINKALEEHSSNIDRKTLKIFLYFILTLMLPFILFFGVLIGVLKAFKLFIATEPSPKVDLYGYVSPIMKNIIYLSSKAIQKNSLDVNQIISHENIHILQTSHGDLDIEKSRVEIERVNNYCERNTRYSVRTEKSIKYLFTRSEVEARIHELVSAFYISTGVLECLHYLVPR